VGRSPGYGPTVELEPALELQVFGGATHYRRLSPDEPGYDPFASVPLVGEGHVVLDGVSGYAATAEPVVLTDGSFTVVGRVQLATGCTTRPMTLLSQPGVRASGFDLGCAPDDSGGARWRVVLPVADTDTPASTVVSGESLRPDPSVTGGQLVAMTYDAAYRSVRLYVDGQMVGSATDVPATWAVDAGGLQIGRALVDGEWGQYLAGTIDELRVYSGVLDQVTIAQLASLTPLPNL
ncbi:MAG: LamG domain-containing protein, partial [Micromonosporaceae bacterium]|nr:LamG domain-containing protein [Micromonosporaceae bacterium]